MRLFSEIGRVRFQLRLARLVDRLRSGTLVPFAPAIWRGRYALVRWWLRYGKRNEKGGLVYECLGK